MGDALMIPIGIQIDTIVLEGDRVRRHWEPQPDGSLQWRKRAEVIWCITRHNVCTKKRNRPMVSHDGMPFRVHEQPVTLDHFVLLADSWRYCHIATGLTLTARQINKMIFTDQHTWPVRYSTGERLNPAAWIRKFNRVDSTPQFRVVREALHVAA
jgi:hypothetical protein